MTIHYPSAVVAGALAAAAVLLYLFDPATTAAYPSCPFRALTGLLCPLCGGLRAAHALLHGDIVEAFWLNPLMFSGGAAWLFALNVVPGVAPELKLGPTARRSVAVVGPSFSSGMRVQWFGAAGVVIFTVARNLL